MWSWKICFDVMLKHKPYKIIGIDSGNSIIKENKKIQKI